MVRKAPKICRVLLEALEERTLLTTTATIMGTPLTLPGGNLNNYFDSNGNFDASPVMADLAGNGQQDIIVVCGDDIVRAYAYSASTTYQLMATYDTTGFKDSNGNSIAAAIHNTPVVVNMPGVGQTVWFGNDNGYIFGFNAVTGASLITPFHLVPQDGVYTAGVDGINIYGSLTAADVDGDGVPEIIANGFHGTLAALKYNATTSSVSPVWEFNNDDSSVSGPAVGDINGDMSPDIVVGADSSYAPYTNFNGQTDYFYWSGGRINVISADGRRELVVQTDEVISSSPALADLTGSGKLDIISGSGYYYPQPDVAPFPGNYVKAIAPDGTTLWSYQTEPTTTDGRVFASPAIGDLNNDGKLDVAVVDGSGVVHAINNDGTKLWTFQLPNAVAPGADYSSPIIADFTGTGQQDVIIAEGPYLYVLNGANGSVVYTQTFNTSSNHQLFFNSPAIGHFKGDASWQMVLVSSASDATLSQHLSPTTLTVIDLGNSTTDAPDWGQFRRTENHWAVERDPTFCQNLINSAYQAFYDRLPTALESQIYMQNFSQSSLLVYALGSIVGSTAARTAQIQNWYSTYIGRAPADWEVSTWLDSDHLGGGMTYSTAQATFVASPEFFSNSGGTVEAWITAVYQNLLGRAAGSTEIQSWVDALNAAGGNTFANRRDVVAMGFFLSHEKTDKRITDFFANVQPFGITTPDAATLASAGWALRNGGREEFVYVQILGSLGDYSNFLATSSVVRGYFRDLIGREATTAEVAYWVQQIEGRIDGGESMNDALTVLADFLMTSTAGRTLSINVYYQMILGRNATATEISTEIVALNSGKKYTDLVYNLLGSDEFFNTICGGNLTTYINQVYWRILLRDPADSGRTLWLNNAATENIRQMLPMAVLTDDGAYQNFINTAYLQILRRYANTPADQTRMIANPLPYLDQADVTAWEAGTEDYEAIKLKIILTSEYYNMTAQKADWLGAHWLS